MREWLEAALGMFLVGLLIVELYIIGLIWTAPR